MNFPKIAFLGLGGSKMDISNENYKFIFLIVALRSHNFSTTNSALKIALEFALEINTSLMGI